MIKFITFSFVAIALLPIVVADPVMLNLTMRCDFPEIQHWCAEVLVWEEDSAHDDALEYTWKCTSARTMQFLLKLEPNGDGELDHHYEINHKTYSNCSPDYKKKREQRCRCHENTYSQVPKNGKTFINRNYNFYLEQGKSMTQKPCQIPKSFQKEGTHMLGSNFVDSPCNLAFLMKDLE